MHSQHKQMKVSTRLALGFGAVALIGVIIATVGAMQMRGLSVQLSEVANDRMVKVDQFTRLKDNSNVIARAARNVLISKEAGFEAAEKKKIEEMRAENKRLLDALDKTLVLPEARALLKTINGVRPAYNQGVDEALALDTQGQAEAAGKLLIGPVRDQQNTLFAAIDASSALQRDIASKLAKEAEAASLSASVLMVGLAILMALVGGAITWLLVRSLSRALGAEPAHLGNIAQRVASGDLSEVAGASHAPVGSVLASLGGMQTSLAVIVGQVRQSSDSIATGSTQIATGNTDLSQRTEEQASNLQQTAASMEELAGTVKTTADTSVQANQLASSASAAAVKGGEMMSAVVTTMQDISAASRKISDIIGVIDGIAFQTNILALNAAVEAARAGEQGRGFAVVAGEVRTLAQRSAEAAKEIKTLIGASVEKVEAGTKQVDEAGSSMGEIVAQVKRVSLAISEIANATTEQSTGISQVGDAVAQLDQVTQQNAALVEESAAAAESLKHQAAKLAEVVGKFKLSDQDAGLVGEPSVGSPSVAPVERRGPNRATNVTRPAFKKKSGAAEGQAPVATHATAQTAAKTGTDDWESF